MGRGETRHAPVLLNEVVELLRPAGSGEWLVDATVGLGGHAEALLERYGEIRLLGIDRDPEALQRSAERLERFGSRVHLVAGRHESLIEILDRLGIEKIAGLLADLGVSSMQLDDAHRGFSFRAEGPLDMRMSSQGRSAADLLREESEEELARIIYEYGEEPMSRRIARAIVAARTESPLDTTTQLAAIIKSVKRKDPKSRIDPATLTFQALRIAVNEELTSLGSFVEAAVNRLLAGARIGVISFHSLEDRIVKQTLRKLEGLCNCPPGLPICRCGAVRQITLITRRPIEAGEDEEAVNPRARSAKLRVAEKVQS